MDLQQYTQQHKQVVCNMKIASHQLLTYPVINKQALNDSMLMYKAFVHNYNTYRLPELNGTIEQYNALVTAQNKALKPDKNQLNQNKTKFKLYVLEHYGRGMKTLEEYNEQVEEFNKDNRLKVKKRKYKKVAYASAQIFYCILGHASYKLKMRNLERLQYRQPTELNALEGFTFPITAHSLTSQKITINELEIDIPKLDVCNKTVRNHIKRLLECGVIVDYKFSGYQLAAKIRINPEILIILDNHRPYQKQSPNGGLGKGLPINNSSYRTLDNKKDNKATAKADCPTNPELEALKQVRGILAGSASISDPDPNNTHFYRNNTQQAKQSSEQSERKRKKIAPKKEKEARPMLESMGKLMDLRFYDAAQLLANGDFDHYKPHSMDHFEREALNGSITKKQFRHIAILDFTFTTAQLWKDKTVFVGEWYNALKQFENHYFLSTHNGENHIPHKTTILKTLREYRHRVKWARNYCNRNPEFRLLFPVAYFDEIRKHSFEGGFAYTKKHYKRSIDAAKRNAEKKKDRDRNAKKREISNKIRVYVRKYLAGKCSFEQLTQYVNRLERKNQRDKGYYSRMLYHTLEVEKEKPI